DRGANQALRAFTRNRLDADTRGLREPDLFDAHLLLQPVDDLFCFGRLGGPLDAGVDVFRVLAEDHHVDLFRVLDRRWDALEPAHRPQTDVEVERLPQRDIERSDAAADRRRERSLDADVIALERLDGLVRQPVVDGIFGLFAGEHFLPNDLALAAVHF